jgi:transcriptional regulator with XRE-family HTH domain
MLIVGNEDSAREKLCKGITGPRWRKCKTWDIKNTILMGQLKVKELPLSEFAEAIGVNPRTVSAWIYEGRIPSDENMQKCCEYFDIPAEVLFREVR